MLLPHNPNAFARSPLDRAAHLRRDADWLGAALTATQTRLIPFFEHRPFIIDTERRAEAGWLAAHARVGIAPADAPVLFLGLGRERAAHFALEIADPAPLRELGRFDELRAIGPRLGRDDLAALGCARAIFEWHAKNQFCANCGAPSRIVEAGWKRECPACAREHFPRVDPVVIMLATHGDKCLLGRQRTWPSGMHSALAGFIEPGEAIEEAVARETLEEAGLIVREVRLHSTQPWPFPHSLMIGAICDVENEALTIDETELESARWFSREEARAMLAGNHADCFCPPSFAIAHQLLKSWAE